MSGMPNIEAAVAQAAAFVQATWQQTVMGATQVPGSRPISLDIAVRKLYADSIVLNNMLAGEGSVAQKVLTVKQIARDLEYGRGPFDMKPALLAGPKARVGKNGTKYNIIPFRHGTSSASGPNSNFKPMPQDIYQQARALKASVSKDKGMKWGGRLTGTEQKYGPGKNPTTGYQHKNGRYEGMVRIAKDYAKTTQSKYLTFRIVSSKSDPLSWWHPGYQAHHIAESVSAFCRPAVEEMVREGARLDLLDVISSMEVR